MIVNYREQGWEIISQRAHGLLAAAIANQWAYRFRSIRWIETLIAIAEHDDAQVELNQPGLLTPQGGPVDFTMRKMEFAHCKETMTRAYNKSTYIAMLCVCHLEFLCKGNGSDDDDVKKFIKDQVKARKEWLDAVGMDADELMRDYRLLEWCDALSLLLCKGMCQPEGREIDISEGPDGKIHKLSAIDNNTLTIKPWPFESNEFELHCELRLIPEISFRSDEEFKSEFLKCLPRLKSWKFKRGI